MTSNISTVFNFLSLLLQKILEFFFIIAIVFISFISLRTPYDMLEDTQKNGFKKYGVNVIRFFSFFCFGAPLIYLGLRMSNLPKLTVDFLNVNNIYQFFFTCLATLTKIKPIYYILVILPFFIVLLLKYQLGKMWYELNKESVRLLNIRLIQFRNPKIAKKAYLKAKKVHLKGYKKLTQDIITNTPVLFTLYGLLLIFIVASFSSSSNPIELYIIYLIPLLMAWSLVCLFLTIFEKTISEFINEIFVTKDYFAKGRKK